MNSGSTSTRLRTAALGVLVMVAWLLPLAVPVAARTAGSTRLSDPSVTPRSGTTATTVAFSVVYRNREGSGPDWVRVLIDGVARDMRAVDAGAMAKTGIPFTYATKLRAGTHQVRFESRGRDRFEDARDGGTVRIVAAAAGGGTSGGGKPGGGTPPGGGGKPGGGTPPGGGGKPGGGTPGGTPGGSDPTNPGTGGPTPGARSGSTGDAPIGALGGRHEPDTDAIGPDGTGALPGSAADRPWAPRPEAATAATSGTPPGGPVADGSNAGPPGPAGSGPGGSDAGLRLPGAIGLPGDRIGRLLPIAVASSTVTTLALAFLVFGKRRRDEQPPAPDDTLARAAGSPYAFVAASDFAAPHSIPATALPSVPAFDPGTGGTDVDLPRWRRPSLLAARKFDPVRDAGTGVRLTFERDPDALAGVERRPIRYRIVRLLDRPDELLGQAIGSLDEGDEVAVVERHGTYRRVLAPDGQQGWLHKMTLGDPVVDAPAETEPEIDADVLLAFLAARARG